MANDDAARLIAGSFEQLGHALARLQPQRVGYITAEDFERLTGEELEECSAERRKMMTELAVHHGCTIRTTEIERRVYFTKSRHSPS
jgi:hypothetical protein